MDGNKIINYDLFMVTKNIMFDVLNATLLYNHFWMQCKFFGWNSSVVAWYLIGLRIKILEICLVNITLHVEDSENVKQSNKFWLNAKYYQILLTKYEKQ